MTHYFKGRVQWFNGILWSFNLPSKTNISGLAILKLPFGLFALYPKISQKIRFEFKSS